MNHAAAHHVAFILPGLDRIGGAERQTMLLAMGLAGRGWQVSVVALTGTGGEAARQLTTANVDFLSLHMRKGLADPRGWLRFHRWLTRNRPDVVHAHLPHAVWLARWSRLAAPFPVLVDTVHTSATGGLARKLGYRLSSRLPDLVTAVSSAAAEAYLAARMADPARLVVLPNGIDPTMWKPGSAGRQFTRMRLGLTSEFVWLAAGRLEPVKDYPLLLHAMALTPRACVLLIAGSGSQKADLRRLACTLGLADRVHFLGFQADVLPWLQAADAFVLTSRYEGLPMSLIEAAACGLPAVATDVPGTREVLLDGETGWLSPASPPPLAKAMTWMMDLDRSERASMGLRARALAVEKYSLDSILYRWETLYIDLLGRNHYPRPIRHATQANI
jgi:glycosyltransferase involved in cell wall biosynthesis